MRIIQTLREGVVDVLLLFTCVAGVPGIARCADYIYWTGADGTVNRLDLGTGTSATLVPAIPNQGPIAIAADVPHGKLYWNGTFLSGTGVINRSNVDGTGVEGVVGGLFATTHLAVDSAGGKIYFRSENFLKRANLDGSVVESLTSSGALETTVCASTLTGGGGLAFDAVDQKLYFGSNTGSGICRVNPDGSSPELVLDGVAAHLPRGMVVDPVGRRLYYIADNNTFGIKSADLAGSGVVDHYTPPFSAALDLSTAPTTDPIGGKLYWAEIAPPDYVIKRSNLNGSGIETVFTLATQAMGVVFVGGAAADLSVTNADSPDPVIRGGSITYTVVVSNAGPDSAAIISLTDTVPANTKFFSNSGAPGWSCINPPTRGSRTGTITCTRPSLAPNASSTFTIVVNANPGTPPGTIITNTAAVSSSTSDSNAGNNSATAATAVNKK